MEEVFNAVSRGNETEPFFGNTFDRPVRRH
jgi:hypothetical protein